MDIKHAEIPLDLRVGFPLAQLFVVSLARLASILSQSEFRREMFSYINMVFNSVFSKNLPGLNSHRGVTQ